MTVSTNLGPWVNRRGIFDRHTRNDVFRDAKLASAQRWGMTPKGQHVELGIAEQNLFLLLGAAGLTPAMTGARLLPVGTVYDPFVNRGLDALIYACYQDARFLLVSTPSGLSLAPEGGQHQSDQHAADRHGRDRLASFEPAHVDELAILLRHAFDCMQQPDGSAVWLRLSTRQLEQKARALDPAAVIAGAHWVVPPREGAPIALAYQGPVAPEAEAAFAELAAEEPGAGLLAITSPDRLHAGWLAAQRGAARRASGTRRPMSSGCWRRWRRERRWSRCWTAIRRRMPGSARCAGSAWWRSGRTISARAATSRICIGNTGWTRTRCWTPAPRRCWRGERARRIPGATDACHGKYRPHPDPGLAGSRVGAGRSDAPRGDRAIGERDAASVGAANLIRWAC